jgi:hypothetical protein
MNNIWIILGVFAVLIGAIIILKGVRARQLAEIAAEEAAAATSAGAVIQNRGEVVAAAASCIAEVMGKDVTGLRIVSIRQVG